jgi:hypothetical protein
MRQAARDFAQQLVACFVSQHVVDALEIIQVQIEQSRAAVGAQACAILAQSMVNNLRFARSVSVSWNAMRCVLLVALHFGDIGQLR